MDGHSVTAYVWGDPAASAPTCCSRMAGPATARGSRHGCRDCAPKAMRWSRSTSPRTVAVAGQLGHPARLHPPPARRRPAFRPGGRRDRPFARRRGDLPMALTRGLQARRAVLIAPAADPVAAAERFADVMWIGRNLCQRMFAYFESRIGITFDEQQAHHTAPMIGRPGADRARPRGSRRALVPKASATRVTGRIRACSARAGSDTGACSTTRG